MFKEMGAEQIAEMAFTQPCSVKTPDDLIMLNNTYRILEEYRT
jgi:hypothetical protein